MPATETFGRTESDRAQSADQLMTNWPAVPTEEELLRAMTYDKFIRKNVASPRGKDLVRFPDPYGRQAFLDLTPLMLHDVVFKKPAMGAAVHALWTVEHSLHYHEAIRKLFTSLGMNEIYEGPEVPEELAAMEPALRRATAIQDFMHSGAEYAASEHSIGLAWTRPIPEQPGKTAHQFLMLPRNTSWMGFGGQLPLVKDCYFRVCAADAGTPLHAVGYPASQKALNSVKHFGTDFSCPETRTLTEILNYHGAAGCYWRPQY